MNQVITDEDRVRLAKKEYDSLKIKKEVIISVSEKRKWKFLTCDKIDLQIKSHTTEVERWKRDG